MEIRIIVDTTEESILDATVQCCACFLQSIGRLKVAILATFAPRNIAQFNSNQFFIHSIQPYM